MSKPTYIRDASKIHAALREAEDGSIVAKKQLKILIPERYVEKGMASIAADIYILGIFAIVVDDQYYGVSKAIAMMRIKPSLITTVKIEGSNYLEFTFAPGSVVVADSELVRDSTMLYNVFDEFVFKGRVPWFIDYRKDLGTLFESSNYHVGVDFGRNHVVLEIIAAAITRMSKDATKFYRHAIFTHADLDRVEPANIPLRSISYGATNTTAKLVGSYFGEGLDSALVNPSERVEKIESILTM